MVDLSIVMSAEIYSRQSINQEENRL